MSQHELTSDTLITRSDALLSNNLGEDVVMMDIEQGAYYGLEAVAARIWTLTEQPVSINAICDQLTKEYQVSPDQCRGEVMAFVENLLSRKIVHIVA